MIETVLYSASDGFPMLAIPGFCALTAGFAMILVAWHDCRTFEIDYAMLGVAALCMAGLIAAAGGPDALGAALATGGLATVLTEAVRRWKPGQLGQGDIWLMGFVVYAAGPDWAVPVLAVFCLFCVLTSASYSMRRGKRLFRSMFPAALPGMAAAALAVSLRLGEAAGGPEGPVAFKGAEFAGHALLALLLTGFIAGGIVLITWRKRSWNR